MLRFFVVVCCLLVFVIGCQSLPSNLNVTGWQADWIGVSQDSQPNSWYCFRDQIELKKAPKQAITKIACDSKYWLWVNDEMVVFEGQLKRGPNPDDTYYDQVNLAKHLKKGKNTIAVLVWYCGKHGFSHNSSSKSGLVYDAKIEGKRFVSDSSWKVRQHPIDFHLGQRGYAKYESNG